MGLKPLYIERLIEGDPETVWRFTHDPEQHNRWDLRFTSIEPLDPIREDRPYRFRYSTRLGFGLQINGEGESTASWKEDNKLGLSILEFGSSDPKSLIRKGSCYWKYRPAEEGVRFITGYQYDTRFGWLGRTIDRLVFRPLMGWATAWSFDRLRLWVERGQSPEISLRLWWVEFLCRMALAVTWIYHGLVPKILFPETGELDLITNSGLFPGWEIPVLYTIAVLEIAFGLLLLLARKPQRWFGMSALLLTALSSGAFIGDAQLWKEPFNPVTFNLALIALSVIGWLIPDTPRAQRCLRKPL